jgi:hypothetical protein
MAFLTRSSIFSSQDGSRHWCIEFGNEWRPFSKTELYSPPGVAPGLPPPLPPSQISNFYAWMFAFVPLIGSIVEATLSQNGVDVTPGIALIGYLTAYLVLVSLDTRMIKRSGNMSVYAGPNLLWFLLAPVYLWMRATYLRQRRFYFWVWVACFVVGIAIDIVAAGGTLSGTGLKVVKTGQELTVTAVTDHVILQSISVNHGNCEVTTYPPLPHTLKFGESFSVSASCNSIETTITTDRGESSFTWGQ